MSKAQSEPVIVIGLAVTVLTIVQQLAFSGISPGVHAIIASVLIVLGAVLTRLQVTPVAKVPARPSAATANPSRITVKGHDTAREAVSLPPAHVSGQLHKGPHDGETVWMPWARIEIPVHGWEGEELVTSLYQLKGPWRGQSLAHYDYDGRASTA